MWLLLVQQNFDQNDFPFCLPFAKKCIIFKDNKKKSMRKERKDKHFLHKPVYPGGIKAIRKFIGAELQYPTAALKAGIEGSVYLRYDINYEGKVVEAKVITGLGYGCDEEAIRLVKLLCFEVAKTRGVRVLFHKNIRIHFNLPKQKEAPPSVQYAYQLSSPAKTKEQQPPGKSFGYTIRF